MNLRKIIINMLTLNSVNSFALKSDNCFLFIQTPSQFMRKVFSHAVIIV